WRRKPSLTASLQRTPEDITYTRLEISHQEGCASSASTIGRPNASPTIAIVCTFSRATVSSSSSALNFRDGNVTTEPPWLNALIDDTTPVPCINGHAHRCT